MAKSNTKRAKQPGPDTGEVEVEVDNVSGNSGSNGGAVGKWFELPCHRCNKVMVMLPALVCDGCFKEI